MLQHVSSEGIFTEVGLLTQGAVVPGLSVMLFGAEMVCQMVFLLWTSGSGNGLETFFQFPTLILISLSVLGRTIHNKRINKFLSF